MIFFNILAASSITSSVTLPNLSNLDVVLVFDGDSLTEGSTNSGIEQYYPKEVNTYFNSVFKSKEFYSYAVGGQTLIQMISDASSQIYPKAQVGKENILVAWEEANAMLKITTRTGVKKTAVENFNDMKSYFQGAKDAGFQHCILITGYYPRLNTSGEYRIASYVIDPASVDEMEVYLNMVANADINTVPWDYHIDLRNAPNIGGTKEQLQDPTYFADYIHLQALGYNEIAIMVESKINQIL